MKPTKGIAVDGACEGNPGYAEYRGVDIATGEQLFHQRIGLATNNIAEFVGLVHALAIAKKRGEVVYSDSTTAISWVKNARCNTTFSYSGDMIKRAEKWLKTHSRGQVKKWDTRRWGEIPADFNRK